MLALGILKQAHDPLALVRRKIPRILLKTGPGGRLAGANGLEGAWRLLSPSRSGGLLLRAGAQKDCGGGNHDGHFHQTRSHSS
jgi:hypothetical protein